MHASEHNMSFIHHFCDHFPDPDNIFHTLHGKLWKEDNRGHKPSGVESTKISEYVQPIFAVMNTRV